MEPPMNAQAQEALDFLSRKLKRVQSRYEWARSRGDSESINQYQIQLDAITGERDRLSRRESASNAVLTIADSEAED